MMIYLKDIKSAFEAKREFRIFFLLSIVCHLNLRLRFFKTSDKSEIGKFIYNQNHTKSIVIENAGDKLSIGLFYGDTLKITPRTFDTDQEINFFDKLKERYKLCKIGDCACKPKKTRVWVDDFEYLKFTIEELKWISSIIDDKLGIGIYDKDCGRSFSGYNTIVYNHSSRRMSDNGINLIFTGDTLEAVYDGNHYNFRFDQRTKECEYSYIKGKI